MTVTLREPPRTFVPEGAGLGDWSAVARLFDDLVRRELPDRPSLERWIVDVEELRAALEEARAVREIAVAKNTADDAARAEHDRFVEAVREPARRRFRELDRKYLGHPLRRELPPERYRVLDRDVETRDSIYREENVPLLTEIDLLAKEYDRIVGAMTVVWEGKETTIPQMVVHVKSPDRSVRERAWRLVAERRLRDRKALDDLYDELLRLRVRLASNAGFSSYTDYRFRELARYDYTPDDCRRFALSVEKVFVPLCDRILADRRRRLGLSTLRPWDMAVDPDGREPLRPFSTAAELMDGCEAIFARVDPELGENFRAMRELNLLDLDNRKDKAPGGFMAAYALRRLPFIFMNSTGLDQDVRTLVHEGGHALHTLACRDEPLSAYRDAPIEFAEVASMGMELLALPHLGVFYGEEDVRRTADEQLRRVAEIFPVTSAGDSFQAWVYSHPGHTRAERDRVFQETIERFEPGIDWSGLEEIRACSWQRVLHFFHYPFYFIDYAFAQIGALQIWVRARANPREAAALYRKGLALGGSRPLPELYAAAGARFAFDEGTLAPLAAGIAKELDLP